MRLDKLLSTCAIATRSEAGKAARAGKIVVNGKEMSEYFPVESLCGFVLQVLKVAEQEGKVDITANICGGGMAGQAGALRHGVARALVTMDEELKAKLKAAGMMTRDSRVKERKKSGQPGARKRFQFSKR